MEDSTLTTIEFLRARLLSERSASRTAKQRADELAKRVVELEEKLKCVSLQKKKAERETEEVLAILENNGISDCTEALDSSSDQEQVLEESRQDNNSTNEDSTLPGRSLSWKSSSDNPSSTEKKCTNQTRIRQSRFISASRSSSKPRVGKSCRQIKRRDMRSSVDDVEDESLQLDARESGVDTGSENISSCFDYKPENSQDGFETKEEKGSAEVLNPALLECQSKGSSSSSNLDGNKRDVEMENAIENQPKLIGWYEAEEIAQREWEEKFREDGSCTPDSCEYGGNQSDITEERDEVRVTAEHSEANPSHGKEAKAGAEEASFSKNQMNMKTVSNGSIPAIRRLDLGCSQNQHLNKMPFNKSLTVFPEFSFPCKKESPGSSAVDNQKNQELSSREHQAVQKSSSYLEGDVTYRGGMVKNVQKHQQPVQQHGTPTNLECVLDELQRAKLSLKRELTGLPSPTLALAGPTMVRSTGTSFPTFNAGKEMEIVPLGCAGLFRLPTDFQFEPNNSIHEFRSLQDLHPNSKLTSLRKSYPCMGNEVSSSNTYIASPELEIGLRNSTRSKPYMDLYMNTGMMPPLFSSSNNTTYTSYPPPSYADLIPRIPSEYKFSQPYPSASTRSKVNGGDHFLSFTDRHQMIPNNLHNIQ